MIIHSLWSDVVFNLS